MTETRERRILDPDKPLARWGIAAWLVVGIAAAFWIGWHVAGLLRIVVFPLVLAIFPAAILMPVYRWLTRRGAPPALSAFLTTATIVLAVAGLITLVTIQVRSEISGLTDQLSSAMEDLRGSVPFLSDLDPEALFGASGGEEGGSGQEQGGSGEGSSSTSEGEGSAPAPTPSPSASEGSGSGSGQANGNGAGGSSATDAAMRVVRGIITFLAELLLGLVATFFYLKDGDRIARWLQGFVPRGHRGEAEDVGEQVWESVSGYIRGQAIVAVVDGALVAIGLLLVGVPLALTLGVLVTAGAFIPVVGSIIAGAIAVGVALATKGIGGALIVLAIVVGVQQLEGNVLAPYVLGRRLDLHPLAVLVAITAGAVLLGPFGAIIAVPLAASIVRASNTLELGPHNGGGGDDPEPAAAG